MRIENCPECTMCVSGMNDFARRKAFLGVKSLTLYPINQIAMYRYVLLIVKSVCAVLAGALLIADPQAYITLMVQIIGGVFLLAGLVPVISFWFPSAAGPIRPFFPVVGAGSALLGMMLILVPGVFIRALMYVLAVLFLLGGVQQLASQLGARGVVPVRWWMVVMSLALVVLGVFVLANPMRTASVPFFLLGIGCIYYGVTELLRGIRRAVYEHRASHRGEYVDYEEVPDGDTMRK